jgi:drug/metabolite transporter (DMT)-like permease
VPPLAPPSYRERLRVEGAALAALGLLGSVAIVVARPEQATRWPLNTAGQLAVVAGLLGWFGPRVTRRTLERSVPLEPGEDGTGEPTPLWHLPLVVGGLAATVVALGELHDRAGWDAALRVTLGCALVGATQAVPLARLVAADERATGRRHLRLRGSRLGRGTKLGWRPA